MADRPIIDSAALARMTPPEIATALRDGRLDMLLGGANVRRGPSLSAGQRAAIVAHMNADEFAAAVEAGLLPDPDAPATDDVGTIQQGAMQATPTGRARLRGMTPDEIRRALVAGELDGILRGER